MRSCFPLLAYSRMPDCSSLSQKIKRPRSTPWIESAKAAYNSLLSVMRITGVTHGWSCWEAAALPLDLTVVPYAILSTTFPTNVDCTCWKHDELRDAMHTCAAQPMHKAMLGRATGHFELVHPQELGLRHHFDDERLTLLVIKRRGCGRHLKDH